MASLAALDLFGTNGPVPVSRALRAGPLTCRLVEGRVDQVAWHGVEILRGLAYLFRDRDWGTAPAPTRDLDVSETPEGFVATFEFHVTTSAGALRALARVEGRSDGHISFEVSATPDADLETNRCGFVVLHPASAAGRPLRIVHVDGTAEDTTFPQHISPSQPAFAIRSLTYSPEEGIRVDCILEAELPHDPTGKFEMEDQRNWSDASFKTYVASLLDPWPYVLPAGRTTRQRVRMQARGKPHVAAAAQSHASDRIGMPGQARMPDIGVGVPPGLSRARAEEIDALRDLEAAWWVVEVDLEDRGWQEDLAAVATHGSSTRARIQLDVIAPDTLAPAEAVSRVAQAADASHLAVDAIRFLPASMLKSFQPTDRWPDVPPPEAYARAARSRWPSARIGGGMFTYFTELNRARPSAAGLDFIGHATCPIVHAADDASVMQTLEALPHIVRSTQALWPGLAYRLGPSAIGMRRNPYGQAPAANPQGGRVAMAALDPRHGARFGAAWLVAYAARTIPLGLEVLSLLESHGPRGPLGRPDSRRIPAWGLLGRLAQAHGAPVVALENLPAPVAGIAWQADEATIECMLANTRGEPCSVSWNEPVALDDSRRETRINLGPYETLALACARRGAPPG